MEDLYQKLFIALKEHDKETAVQVSIEALEKKTVDIITLYEEILAPALNNVIDEFEDEDKLIWQEHVRSEIIITVIENAYPYVLKERDRRNTRMDKKVMILCPQYEDHVIGAKMVNDIFTIAGFETIFIGANTPWRTIIQSIASKKPDIISMSVTNFYNLIETKKTIKEIRSKFDHRIKFVLGGYAFKRSKDTYKEIGGDIYLQKLEDIFFLEEEVK